MSANILIVATTGAISPSLITIAPQYSIVERLNIYISFISFHNKNKFILSQNIVLRFNPAGDFSFHHYQTQQGHKGIANLCPHNWNLWPYNVVSKKMQKGRTIGVEQREEEEGYGVLDCKKGAIVAIMEQLGGKWVKERGELERRRFSFSNF